ncbi:MAG TPA: nitroreductase family deazaflavin-dependent oxidoreductase [Myxococcota bacterium]|nr:nitroreductase family deazaflavin-dependent oxidoreductase [Myxococcota bacterium]
MTQPEGDPGDFLYLATVGQKTGRPHLIEIWYVEHEGRYYVVSERRERSHWVQNVRAEPAVAFMAKRRVGRATARALEPERDAALHAKVSALMNARYDWSDGLIVEIAPE